MTPFRRSLLPAAVAALLTAPAYAQVGVGTATPDAKAALDIQAADKGLLIPRLDSAQRAAIVAPPDGLMVFQKNGRVGLWYAFGGTWYFIPDKLKAADNLGNHTATAALNLQSNALRGTGASISGVGIGVRADGGLNMGQNTPGNILAVGYLAGAANTTGIQNQFIGYQSGTRNTTGNRNHFSGLLSGNSNTTGSSNHFNGIQSGFSNTTGNQNHFTGNQSGYANTTGSGNLFDGYQSGLNNRTGSNNQFIGYQSGQGNLTGNSNQFSGYRSGYRNLTGKLNLFVGDSAGINNTSGNRNYAFGMFAGPTTSNLTNAGAIGYNAQVSQSNSLVLGGTGADAVNVGIGTTAPTQRLEVAGQIYSSTGGFRFPDNTVQTTAAVGDNLGNHSATQNVALNSTNDLLLRDAADTNHGLGWYGGGKLWDGAALDGPALYGFGGGALGTNTGGTRTTALYWNNTGNVGVGTTTPSTRMSITPLAIEPKITLWDGGNAATHYGFGISGGQLNYHVNDPGASHVFYAQGKNGDGTELLRVRGDGNVGIGINNPTALLDVNGTTRLRGLTTAGVVTTDASGNLSSVAATTLADNLGNHTATTALNLQGNALTGTGASISGVGVGVRADGGLNMGQNTAGNNVFVGYQAGAANTSGFRNQFVGYQSGAANTTGGRNHFNGYQSGLNNTTGNTNHFSGCQSGANNTTGSSNYFSGFQSGYSNTTGNFNYFSGYQSGFNNTTGGNNLFIGYQSGLNNTTGIQNQFIGFFSGNANTIGNGNYFSGLLSGRANTTGSFNYISGYQSGLSNTTGNNNLFIGYQSGNNSTTGNNNLFVGFTSGGNNITGSNNTAFGYTAGPTTGSLTNAAAFGYNAKVSQSNSLVLGGTGADAVNVGIGTTAPNSTLNVAGSVSLAYVTASADLTLTSAHYTVRRFGGCNTITLPQAGTCTGRIYVLINSNGTGSNVSLAVATSGGIYDDVTNATITSLAPNNRLTVQSDGTNWIVTGR